MKRIVFVLVLIVSLLTSVLGYPISFAADNRTFFDMYNIDESKISELSVQAIYDGLCQETYTLENKELIAKIIDQLGNMEVVESKTRNSEQRRFLVTFKTLDSDRSFKITTDGLIAEISDPANSFIDFKYRFTDENIFEWLCMVNDISRISESQKNNVLLSKNDDIKVFTDINGIKMQLYFDASPKVVNGCIMVPARNIAQALDVRLSWNGKKQNLSLDGYWTLILHIGDKKPPFNPKENSTLDVAPFLDNGKTFIPLKYVAEFFNKNVEYDNQTKTVLISEPIVDGWCIDKKGNYKIKIYEDYMLRGLYHAKTGDCAYFTIPFTWENVGEPTKSIIRSGREYISVVKSINEIKKEHSKEKSFSVKSISKNDSVVYYEFYDKDSKGKEFGDKRVFLMYIKDDKGTTLYSYVNCTMDYYKVNKDKLLENLKTIQAIK